MGQMVLHSSFPSDSTSESFTRLCLTSNDAVSVGTKDWICLSVNHPLDPLTSLFIVYLLVCVIFAVIIHYLDHLLLSIVSYALRTNQ